MLDDEFESGNLGERGKFAFLIAVIFCVFLSIIFSFSLFGRTDAVGVAELDGLINPNNAEQASLERLPGIGVSKAAAIVSYSEQFANGTDGPVLKKAGDLQKVKGIGPKTVENLGCWLKFE